MLTLRGAFSFHRCLQDGAGEVAFVRDSTVFGKRQEESHGYSLLLFYSPITLNIELIGRLASWRTAVKFPQRACL